MKIYQENNNIIIENSKDFCLKQTFDCGQCFRWEQTDDSVFEGVAFGRVLSLKTEEDRIVLLNTNMEDYENIWAKYFDLSRDYSKIKQSLSSDTILKKAISSGEGIRILRQDPWETLVSFIISASNNIPRIKKIIGLLCEHFGKPLGSRHFSFPDAKGLWGITEEDLSPIRAGFRAKYIVDAVNKVASGEIDLHKCEFLDTDSLKKELMKINGVGEKVADCILLFAFGRTEVFPVDVWIKNTMQKLYPEKCSNLKQIRTAGRELFGEHCGIAQQYLFYHAREKGGNI